MSQVGFSGVCNFTPTSIVNAVRVAAYGTVGGAGESCAPGSSMPTPVLDLDFTTGVLDPRITFSRGTFGTYFEVGGQLVTAAFNQPRFDYDPLTHVAKGLLMEGGSTNLNTFSEDFSDAGYVKTGLTVAVNQTQAPDGMFTADKIVESSLNELHILYKSLALTVGATYTLSVFFKSNGWSSVTLQSGGGGFAGTFDFTTKTATPSGGATSATMTELVNGWFRCTVSGVAIASTFQYIFKGSGGTYAGDGVSGVYVWGLQIENMAFATSYIKTTTAQAGRVSDVALMTGTNFSSWYNASEGTVLAVFTTNKPPTVAFYAGVANITDAGGNNSIQTPFLQNQNLLGYVFSAGSPSFYSFVSSYTTNATLKFAQAYKVNNFAASCNGSVPVTDTLGVLPIACDQFVIGAYDNAGNGSVNGYVKNIKYYNTKLSDAEIQGLTA